MANRNMGNPDDFSFQSNQQSMNSAPLSMDNPAIYSSPGEMDAPPTNPMGMAQASPMPMDNGSGGSEDFSNPTIERIEEIAEAIIDEKWNDLVKTINKIIEWKERTENVIVRLQTDFNNLRKDYDILTKGVLGKVGEYNKTILNVGVEIKAMEKVFEKVLPMFTENVHTLDRVTQDLKTHSENTIQRSRNPLRRTL